VGHSSNLTAVPVATGPPPARSPPPLLPRIDTAPPSLSSLASMPCHSLPFPSRRCRAALESTPHRPGARFPPGELMPCRTPQYPARRRLRSCLRPPDAAGEPLQRIVLVLVFNSIRRTYRSCRNLVFDRQLLPITGEPIGRPPFSAAFSLLLL
jgi:hypothetical protein